VLPITESIIRTSFVNASLRERNNLTLPSGFPDLEWDKLDFLGWRDAKIPSLGYVVANVDDATIAILLRQSEGTARSRPQCAWCADILLPNDVALFTAKRAGQAGRNGNTIGTLVCSRFECSTNVRKRPSVAYIGFDVEAARERRIESLIDHVSNFVRDVASTA
jgi:hypothetical protein